MAPLSRVRAFVWICVHARRGAVATSFDLDESNFDRLVFRESTKAALVTFHDHDRRWKALKKDWHQVELGYDAHSSILIGNVDCSADSTKKLCAKHKPKVPGTTSPNILFFEPPDRKGTTYGGKQSADDILSFAKELESPCSVDARQECSEKQNKLLDKFQKFTITELKNWVRSVEESQQRAPQHDMERMRQMMKDVPEESSKELMKNMKESMKEQKEHARSATAIRDQLWAEREELRFVKMVLNKKLPPSPPIKAPKKKKRKRAAKDEM